MVSRLIELNTAAKMLGVTPDELSEMRSRNEIYGYRDGTTWKFKSEEIERVAAERGTELSVPVPKDSSGIDAELEELFDVSELQAADGDPDSILVSEEELGGSGAKSPSTVIGKTGDEGSSGESDIQLAGDSGTGKAAGSDVALVADSGEGGSDVKLVASDDLSEGVPSSSDVHGGGGRKAGPSDTDDLSLGESDLTLGEGDLALGEDDLELDTEAATHVGADAGSDVDLDSSDADDDLVLGTDSDVTKSPGDSGISLGSPSESGLSLEEPLELGGSAVESLELGEDDMVPLDEEVADPDAATQLKADDDFLLTPVEDMAGEESDSGSQVIALDTEEFDQTTDNLLTADGMAAAPLLEEEAGLVGAELAPGGGGAALTAPAPLIQPKQAVEAPYSIWNVLSLMFILLLLSLTGMMMVDLLRSMWSWEGTYSINSPIMDKIIEMFGG